MKIARWLPAAGAMILLAACQQAPAAERPAPDVDKILASLDFKSGQVTLNNGLVTLTLSEGYRFLDKADARKVLVDLWGNPPGQADALGMIVPANFSLAGGNTWAVVITWSEEGYVKDDDADQVDYADLLKQMQAGTREANAERAKQGYPAVELVGWAEPPHYDRATHKLYWAKNLKFGDQTHNTLNYCIRALGRRGVLELNAVASMDQLPEITAAAPQILAMTDFKEGHRYVDFNPSTDQVAAYGLATLVAGGIAAKVGLLKGLWLAALAAKKFIIMGAIALVAVFRKAIARLFNRSRGGPSAAS